MRVTDELKFDVNKIHFFLAAYYVQWPWVPPCLHSVADFVEPYFPPFTLSKFFANIVVGASSPDKTNSEYDVAGLLKLPGARLEILHIVSHCSVIFSSD